MLPVDFLLTRVALLGLTRVAFIPQMGDVRKPANCYRVHVLLRLFGGIRSEVGFGRTYIQLFKFTNKECHEKPIVLDICRGSDSAGNCLRGGVEVVRRRQRQRLRLVRPRQKSPWTPPKRF